MGLRRWLAEQCRRCLPLQFPSADESVDRRHRCGEPLGVFALDDHVGQPAAIEGSANAVEVFLASMREPARAVVDPWRIHVQEQMQRMTTVLGVPDDGRWRGAERLPTPTGM